MDPKRELTSVDLRALVGELGAYEGAKVDKAYLYGEDLLRLRMRDFDRGRVELLVEVGDPKRVHTADPDRVPPAPERPPDFATKLRNRIRSADFVGVEQYGFDRVLEFEFHRPDEDTTVVAELFGDGNVAVLDGDRQVVACLETVRLKSRTVAPGSTYEFPGSRFDPLAASYEAFVARMEESDADVVRTLATRMNFGGLYAEELCTRAGVSKTLDVADAGDRQYERLYDALDRLAADLSAGDLEPRIYGDPDAPDDSDASGADASTAGADGADGDESDGDDPAGSDADEDGAGGSDDDGRSGGGEGGSDAVRIDRPVDVAPVALEERAALPVEAVDTFDRAVEEYFHRLETATEEEGGGRERPDFKAEIAKRERIIEQQEAAIEDFAEQAERERERAEALYGNYGLVDEVLSTVRAAREDGVPWDDIAERFAEGRERGIEAAEAVRDVDGRSGTVTVAVDDLRVELDPFEGVEHNANRLYEEAKRVERKREGALSAVEDTREELADLRERRDRWDRESGSDDSTEEGDSDGGGDDGDDHEDVDWLSEPSIPVRRQDQWYDRFRWFYTSEDFLVLGGRNADQNEELVKKYLDAGDLFFHTQASGAPATVLKAAGPSESGADVDVPEQSRREAARFAVSYSSVWKDGAYTGDVYAVSHDQVTKTPESGEYLQKGGFAIRGDRTYYEDLAVGAAVGIQCTPSTRVIGGPPEAVEAHAETLVRVEPGRYAQADVAKRVYREFRDRFADTSFVRAVASPDLIGKFLPPGGSRIVED